MRQRTYLKKSKYLPILSGILLLSIILLLSLSQWQFGIFSPKPFPTPTPTFGVVYGPSTYVTSTPTPGPQSFTSSRLGVRFDYANNPDYTATELGNKICIHAVNLPLDNGLCLEIFTKAPEDRIDTAIKKRFLKDGYEKDCHIEIISDFRKIVSNESSTYPTTYSIAQIVLNDPSVYTNPACPKAYSFSGDGINFFLTDTNHPSKLLFIQNGQSGISSGRQNESWYQTIRML